jgi:hypothetical protein
MRTMAEIVSLDAWRSRRREQAPSRERSTAHHPAGRGASDVARLERAVQRLDALARPDADRDRLAPDVERDLLTIVGELAMGWIDQATEHAERLCDRLVSHGG